MTTFKAVNLGIKSNEISKTISGTREVSMACSAIASGAVSFIASLFD